MFLHICVHRCDCVYALVTTRPLVCCLGSCRPKVRIPCRCTHDQSTLIISLQTRKLQLVSYDVQDPLPKSPDKSFLHTRFPDILRFCAQTTATKTLGIRLRVSLGVGCMGVGGSQCGAPRLVVSGINRGRNVGLDCVYSGTVRPLARARRVYNLWRTGCGWISW